MRPSTRWIGGSPPATRSLPGGRNRRRPPTRGRPRGTRAPWYAACNQVRARSTVPSLTVGLTQAQFRDSVWLERRHELYGEFQEWFDLKREGRWLDIMNDRVPAYPGGTAPNASVCRPRQ